MTESLTSEECTKRPWHRDVPTRVTEYLANGGLVNPDLMDHQAVRDLLIDARDVIEIRKREMESVDSASSETRLRGGKAVIRMRDDFLQLVTAYNAVGEYNDAADAQVMAILLNKFEDEHNITEMEWPARVVADEHGPDIAEVER